MSKSLPALPLLAIHSVFLTRQGEGVHAGRIAIFVRTSACSVWSGHEEHRTRDSKNSACALICDTTFTGIDASNGGGRYTPSDLALRVRDMWRQDLRTISLPPPFVVVTGGEPTLQRVDLFAEAMHRIWPGAYLAIETNGAHEMDLREFDWRAVSPKPPMPLVQRRYNEIKLLTPTFPLLHEYEAMADVHWLQPVDDPKVPHASAVRACMKLQLENPRWLLGSQNHKLSWGGIP